MIRASLVLLVLCCLAAPALFAQEFHRPNWQNLDLQHDSVFGISTERAYRELLAGKHPTTVIVAVIDIGMDTGHEALKGRVWTNPREVAGNGVDDDHNGYTDDLHGWNFTGEIKDSVLNDNFELTRLIRRDKPKYDTLTAGMLSDADRPAFLAYRANLAEYNRNAAVFRSNLEHNTRYLHVLDSMKQKIGKDTPTLAEMQQFQPQDKDAEDIKASIIRRLTASPGFANERVEILNAIKICFERAKYDYNLDYEPHGVAGKDENNDHERFYGNPDATGPDPFHGTFIAGLIGAVRNNGKGIDGIADHVQVMSIRIGNGGDERDKNVANAIRYATENGAGVINMSFGKFYSYDKAVVDEAVKYAMSKDVLIVHGAGNDGKNTDDPDLAFFPTKYYGDGSGQAEAWITVGASRWRDDSSLITPFSNYGKRTVDVFAPGAQLYSCWPGSTYQYGGGTSYATPIVAGLAALIREYYPKLSAVQVKDIILRSVVKPTHTVIVKEGRSAKVAKLVWLSDICTSGGVVNAYNALKLAATY